MINLCCFLTLFVTGCEAVKKEGRTQMHNVKEKGFNEGSGVMMLEKTSKEFYGPQDRPKMTEPTQRARLARRCLIMHRK